jgi:hypothetical protein
MKNHILHWWEIVVINSTDGVSVEKPGLIHSLKTRTNTKCTPFQPSGRLMAGGNAGLDA